MRTETFAHFIQVWPPPSHPVSCILQHIPVLVLLSYHLWFFISQILLATWILVSLPPSQSYPAASSSRVPGLLAQPVFFLYSWILPCLPTLAFQVLLYFLLPQFPVPISSLTAWFLIISVSSGTYSSLSLPHLGTDAVSGKFSFPPYPCWIFFFYPLALNASRCFLPLHHFPEIPSLPHPYCSHSLLA